MLDAGSIHISAGSMAVMLSCPRVEDLAVTTHLDAAEKYGRHKRASAKPLTPSSSCTTARLGRSRLSSTHIPGELGNGPKRDHPSYMGCTIVYCPATIMIEANYVYVVEKEWRKIKTWQTRCRPLTLARNTQSCY